MKKEKYYKKNLNDPHLFDLEYQKLIDKLNNENEAFENLKDKITTTTVNSNKIVMKNKENKMKKEKYYKKNRLFIGIVISLLISIFIAIFFVNINISKESDFLNENSYVLDTKIDFDIPSPTPEQLEEIRELSFVDKAFGYYFSSLTVSFSGKSKNNINIIFSDNFEDINFTMWNDIRIIQKSDKNIENPIYIEYSFAKDNNIELNDEIILNIESPISFRVARIYKDNNYFTKSVLFASFINEQKNQLLNKMVKNTYSGAFIEVNDYSKFKNYLNDYKPLGRLNDRSMYEDDEQYNVHYNAWASGNYLNEVTDFYSLREVTKHNSNSLTYAVSSFFVTLILISIMNVVLLLRKNEFKYFTKVKKDKKEIKNYYFKSFIFEMFSFIIVFSLTIYIGTLIYNNYISIKTVFNSTLPVLLSSIVSFTIWLYLNLKLTYYVKPKKNYRKS